MNIRMGAKYLGYLISAEAVFLLPAVLVAFLYGEARVALCLLLTSGICLALGTALWVPQRGENAAIYPRDGFVAAGLGWVLVSLLGALPFTLAGEIPHYVDAVFETVSGFTTTGASILVNVEEMSRGLLFWRSFSHWLGGIGVLAFILAVVRARGAGSTLHLLRAEAPGPQVDKVQPKMRQSMRSLFIVYALLSAVNLALLLAGGMPVFDALCTMFGTAGTGGFGIKADSMAGYSVYLQNVTTVFMALFGVNFSLYFLMLHKEWRGALRDAELRLYVGIMLTAMAAVSFTLYFSGGGSLGKSLQEGAFAVSSVMTTTGFATADFNLWPQLARTLLLLLMFLGTMAGSTGGGLKTARVLILAKSLRAGLYRLTHPNSVRTVKINGRPVDTQVLIGTQMFFCAYIILMLAAVLLVSFDGLSTETNMSAVISCFNNIGPGLDLVGPVGNYSVFSPFAKIVLTLCMLLGRLEIYPVVLLFVPNTWRRKA